jgi:hypothetical protein
MIHTIKIHKNELVEWKRQKLLKWDYIVNIKETSDKNIVEVTARINNI